MEASIIVNKGIFIFLIAIAIVGVVLFFTFRDSSGGGVDTSNYVGPDILDASQFAEGSANFIAEIANRIIEATR